MNLKARLINKEQPTLLIKKTPKLKSGIIYKVKFIGRKRDEWLRSYLRNFNQDYFYFEFVHKIMGAFDLEYKKEYDIEVEEEK